MNRLPSRVAALALAVALFSQPAFSAGGPIARSSKGPGVLTAVRQFLLVLVPSIGQAHGTMDPNGNTSSGPASATGTPPPTTETDAHGTMDPDGGN
jgi:hypothetical protein